MPDAHLGYGLPIGGVLATENSVIPYAVGVDIACRMRLSVFDVPASDLTRLNEQLVRTLQRETMFGVGVAFKKPLEHEVLEADWNVSDITRKNFEKARGQLGTSGSGNHFVEFGIFTLDKPDLGLEAGQYLSLLSHSGSRGTGAAVADFYSKLAMSKHPELPDELRHLAWLDLNDPDGQEYWAAMNLMGAYAAANHALIHRHVAAAMKFGASPGIENHHNFAWKETHNGRDDDRASQGRDARRKRRARRDPRVDGVAGFCRARQGTGRIAGKRQPWGGAIDEPHGGAKSIPLGPDQADARSGGGATAVGGNR